MYFFTQIFGKRTDDLVFLHKQAQKTRWNGYNLIRVFCFDYFINCRVFLAWWLGKKW